MRSIMTLFRRAAPETHAQGDDAAHYKAAVEKAWSVCREAAKGNLETRITHIDEFGALRPFLSAINHLLDMTDAFVRESGASLEHAAGGKFYRRFIERGMLGSFRHGAESINRARESMERLDSEAREQRTQTVELADALNQSAGSVQTIARTLLADAEATHEQSATASSASSVAASSSQTVAAAAEELAASIGEINGQISRSSASTKEVAREAERAGLAMTALSDAAAKIDRVVAFIETVANQTNLLALNATIEAARAGEQGKGFAIVASEVKQLARQCAEAVKQISSEVSAVQEQVTHTASAIGSIGEQVSTVNEIATVIAAAMEEQTAATTNISQNVQEAATATRDVSDNVSQISITSERTKDAANRLLESAVDLSQLAESLSSGLQDMTGQSRAA